MKKTLKTIVSAAALTASVLASMLAVSADSVRTVTIGADLSDAQKTRIFEFFNTDESKVNVIEVNNQDERQYLEGVVSDSIIGTHTYSCAYIEPTTSGGVFVQTANLTWVTAEMLGNALLTAGIENCNVLATAPFEVSGTGALTGVMMAYETSTKEKLDEDKKHLASEELVLTAELSDEEDNTQEDVLQAVNDIKQEVLDEKNPDAEKINSIVSDVTDEYNLTLSDEQMQKLNELAKKFTELDYDKEAFSDSLQNFKDRLTGAAENIPTEEAKNWFQKVWQAIVDFFKNLFSSGSEKAGELSDEAKSFFDEINTDIIEFDSHSDETQTEQPESSEDSAQTEEIIESAQDDETVEDTDANTEETE